MCVNVTALLFHLCVTRWRSFISALSNQMCGHARTIARWTTPIKPPWTCPTCQSNQQNNKGDFSEKKNSFTSQWEMFLYSSVWFLCRFKLSWQALIEEWGVCAHSSDSGTTKTWYSFVFSPCEVGPPSWGFLHTTTCLLNPGRVINIRNEVFPLRVGGQRAVTHHGISSIVGQNHHVDGRRVIGYTDSSLPRLVLSGTVLNMLHWCSVTVV